MALPNKTDLQSMDYSLLGEVFVSIPAKSTVDTNGMDYSLLGEVFWSTAQSSPAAFSKFSGISWDSIAKINGIAKSSIAKVNTQIV